MNTRTSLLFFFVLVLISGKTVAASEEGRNAAPPDLVFGTAAEGRAYWQLAKRFEKVAATKGLNVKVLSTQGSLENLKRLDDPNDAMNVGLTQADALKSYLTANPEFENRVKIVESIGLECVFVIVNADGPIASERDWQYAVSPRVAIWGSGEAMTHELMTQLIPELKDDLVVTMGYADAINALSAESEDRVDLVFIVHRPKYHSPELRAALQQPDRFRLLPIEDRRLRATLLTNEDVYESIEIPLIRHAMGGVTTVPTVCTRGLLVAVPGKISAPIQRKVTNIVETQWMQIYRQSVVSDFLCVSRFG